MLFPYIWHTLPFIHQWRLLICITIDNASDNTVGGSCYFVHQAVSRFAEHHIDMVSSVHCKCQTRAGVSEDINKSFECVTITDSKIANRVLTKSTSLKWVPMRLEQFDFCLRWCKWEHRNGNCRNISNHNCIFLKFVESKYYFL